MTNGSESCSVIEHLLEDFTPERVMCNEIQGYGSWTLKFSPDPELIFGMVNEGFCQVREDTGNTILLQGGDFLLTSTASNLMIVGPSQEGRHYHAEQICKGTATRKREPFRDGLTTRITAGHASFAATRNANALAAGLSVVVRREAANRVRLTLACLEEESRATYSPSSSIQQKLMQVLVSQASQSASLRLGPFSRFDDPASVTGVNAAVRAMRSEPAREWTVASLAAVAFMSRSVFARRFELVIGMPPLRFLRESRMSNAKRALLGGASIKETAALAGFQSDKAFRTAFRQRFDQRPDAFRGSRLSGANSDANEPSRDANERQLPSG